MTLLRLRGRVAAPYIPLLLALFTCPAFAAISLSTSAYTQSFDGMGTSAAAPLPADFRVDKPSVVRTVGTFSAALTSTSLLGGANLATNASNGIYNFGSGTTTTGPDRAVGFLSSGTATQSGNLYAQLANNSANSFSGLQISYSVEKYRHGLNPAGFRIQLFYSTDGNTWTNAGGGFLTSFSADADNTGFSTAPGATVAVTGALNVAIPGGSNLYLAWNYSVSSGTTTTNAQALAIDDISIAAVAGASPTNPSGIGAANPSTVQAGNSTLLTVTVTPGTNPASTGLAVTADLTSIGGVASQQFFDDGTHGDAIAGNNVFSFQAAVPANTSTGAKTLPAAITDAQSRNGSASISLTVTPSSTSPTGTGSANPNTVPSGGSTVLTVTVSPGSNPASTGIGVTGDLTSIGGAVSQQFFDDGTHGDATANDNVFSFQVTAVGSGLKSLPITITDAQSRSGSATIALTFQPPTTVKISQVYGGGGNSGSTFTNDFIELFNASTSPVDITGWSVQHASSTSSTWNVTALCSSPPCFLGAGQYYLEQEVQGTGGTTPLPTPDAIGTASMGATSGKVALVASTAALTATCPVGGLIVDFIGYGTGTGGCSESTPTGTLSNTTAAVRKNNGCVDTDNNLNDFVEIGPIPRNRTAPTNFCGGDPTRLSGLGLVSPVSIEPGSLVLMTVKVSPASLPTSTGIGVSADLTAIGGPASQVFYDDGTHGDQIPGDNTFSFQTTVGVQISFGVKYLVANLTDAQGRTGTAPMTLTVQSPTCGVERWSVKTGTDPDAALVNLNSPRLATIAELRALAAPVDPPGPPLNARVQPAETTLYVVNATLTLYKKEGDVDYHIVIQDASGNTMITEIPSAACVGAGSPFATGVANSRAKFDAKLSANSFFQSASLPVQVKGVGFFDFLHGQTGVAPNGIELHPLLDINFTAVTTASLTATPNPSQYGQPVAIAVTVDTAGTSTPTGTVTLFDGSTALTSNTLDPAGHSTFNISNLVVGPHSLTASYEGDSASAPSTSPILSQVVVKADQTISFAPLPGKTFGDADFSVNATATSSLAVSFSIASGPATITGNLVHLTGAGTVTVRASQASDSNYNAAPNVDQAFTVAKASQTITFAPLPDRTYGDAPFAVSATGGASGQPVLFSASGACTVSSNTVTITGAGSCTVTASQAGDSNFNDATAVARLFTINKAVQGPVTVSAPPDATYGQTGLPATASGGNGTGAYSFSAGPSTACAVNAATGAITVTSGTGTCSITASRAGDANYIDSAPSTPASVSIHKADQTISFAPLGGKTYGDADFSVNATATSSLAVSFSIASGPATITGNLVHLTGAGTVTVRASQAGDSNYTAAPNVDQAFTVAKGNQTISFAPLPGKIFGDADFSVNATATSSLAVSFSIASGPATITGNLVHLTGAGTVTVRASQAGDSNYNAAMNVDQAFTVAKGNQTITFAPLPGKTFGDADFVVNATATSSLAVSFSIASGPATITGNLVHLTGAGTVTVRASQAGDSSYNAAPDLDQAFTVAKGNQTITFAPLPGKTFGDADFTVNAIATSNLAVSFSIASGPATITGNLVHLTGAGTVTVSASQAGDGNYNAAPNADQAFTVAKGNQTITFAPLPNRTFGDADFSVNATATSSLAVSFSIASGPATITGNLVHLTGAGTVTVRASQTGDSNYNAAASVDQAFTVAKGNQTITFAPLPDRTFGNGPFTVSATGGASGQPVLFSAFGACTVSGNTVTITTTGSCTVTASQAGDANFNDATPVPRLFMINKALQGPVTVSAPPDATFGQTGLAATASGGNGTGAFSFSAGSSTACAVNAATGAITVTSGTGTCSIAASRAGDANYNDSAPSTPAGVSIHKEASTTTLVSSKNPTKFGEAVTFTATVTSPAGTPVGTVQFTADGSALGPPVSLSAGGVATTSTAALSVAAHAIVATFSGANFATSQGSLTQTVFTAAAPASGTSCNGSYNGTFVGNLTVSTGQTCTFVGGGVTGNITQTGGNLVLTGAAVGGNVHVQGGGTFSLSGSTSIDGELHIQNLPASSAQNQVCGVNVKGNLQYHNSGAPVEIGAAAMCPGNTVDGNLQVDNNTAAASIFNNTVTGNLEIQNNTDSIMVVSNTVTKNLHCAGNTTIAGNGNTAKQKQGQCANF